MQLTDWFAERSTRGMFTRMVGSWLFVGVPVIAARVWWSVADAIAVFVVTVTLDVLASRSFMGRRCAPR